MNEHDACRFPVGSRLAHPVPRPEESQRSAGATTLTLIIERDFL